MNITVYLGASMGNDRIYETEVKRLGEAIGEGGHTLIYGGSAIGLMGILAEAVLGKGGKVIGVEPQFFVDAFKQHTGITELIVVPDMQTRKKKMFELGDAFIAFPGGTGTLEEISEIISANALELMHKPYVFYNIKGYYNDLASMFDKMEEEGFVRKEARQKIRFADTLEEVMEIIKKV